MRRVALLAGALPIGLGAAFACHLREASPHVFLIVLDAAAAGYFGSYGDAHDTSPNIDRLARESVVFENAYSQSATTIASTASLLTGVRATSHFIHSWATLPEALRTFPELLREQGFETFGFVGNPYAGAAELGFDRGYDTFIRVYDLDSLPEARSTEPSSGFRVTLPEDINEQVFAALPRISRGSREGDEERRGTFAYIHYLQPHKPYDPPGPYARAPADPEAGDGTSWEELDRAFQEANDTGEASPWTVERLEDRYRGNIRYVDAAVGELLVRLREEGLYEDALIVLTADHGEAFFKHRRFGHNATLYDDMTRIPLVLKFPQSARVAPRRLPHLVETIDLPPTLLDFLGLPIPEPFEGDSLWPLIAGRAEALPGPEVVLSTQRRDQHAIRLRQSKYIFRVDGSEELYDLGVDADEQRNLAGERPEEARVLRERLEAAVDFSFGKILEPGHRLRTDPRMHRLLEVLGYVEDEAPPGNPPVSTPDAP